MKINYEEYKGIKETAKELTEKLLAVETSEMSEMNKITECIIEIQELVNFLHEQTPPF